MSSQLLIKLLYFKIFDLIVCMNTSQTNDAVNGHHMLLCFLPCRDIITEDHARRLC